MMSRGVGRIVKKVWKIVGGHRRYVGLDAKGRWKFLKHPSKSKSTSSKTKTTKRSVRKTTKPKKKGGRRGGRILGNVGWKGLLAGTLGLTLAKFLARKFLPVGEKYIDGASMLIVGGVGKVAKIGTAHLFPAGVAMLGSSFLEDAFLGGGVGFIAGAQRGYDL